MSAWIVPPIVVPIGLFLIVVGIWLVRALA
jgi:hypothetical protein